MAAPEIPKKYKALVYDAPGTISTKIEELDTPEPGTGEVLVHLYAHASPLAPFPASK
jgi:propanol-preferring alcohol dehydrogenase